MTRTQSGGLAPGACRSAADCCSGACTNEPYNGGHDFCCLDYQAPCTVTNGLDDCCDDVGIGHGAGCNTHAGFTGSRCCIPDILGNTNCSNTACCSGFCDTANGYCCTPQGHACTPSNGSSNDGCCNNGTCTLAGVCN